MKKKVKKIPKYYTGGITASYLAKNNMPKLDVNFNSNPGTTGANFKMDNSDGYDWNGAMDAMVAASQMGAQTLGIEQGKNAAIFNTIGTAAEMIPGVGKYVSAGLKTIGALAGEGGHVDQNTGEYTKSSGLTRLFGWGRSDDSVMKEANRVKGSILAKQFTEDLKADYANQGINPAPNVLAAEGGIMRQPVDALVSKGELIYNPVTKKLSQVPGSKGKPNKADDVYAKLYEGDVVISNSPTMLMANGKTPAQNLMGMVDKYSTGGTVKAREAIIKKVVNWQEANKTKPQQYAMYSGGTDNVKPYGYNKNLEAFEYWDKDKKEYKKEYLDWVNKLTEQDVKDIFNGNYGDMSTYKGVNANYVPTVEEARKLMTDKKYGDWHKIGKAVVDKKIKAATGPDLDNKHRMLNVIDILPGMTEKVSHHESGPYALTNLYTVKADMPKLQRLPNPSQADGIKAANRTLKKAARNAKLNDIGEAISDLAPLATALFGDYDWHTEQPQIRPAKYITVGADPVPLMKAADEIYNIGNYNFAQFGGSTGQRMGYGAALANNRAKQYADAYKWQQDVQNKQIAQNVGIYNDWAKHFDAARYQAIADTRANEGAAQQMKDSAIRDALEFTQGRRNDKMRLAMMEPLAKYAFDDDTYKKIYSRAIV